MRSAAALLVVVLVGLGCAEAASAAQPSLLTVGHDDRHATATYALPGADVDATIYFATKPDRATDGSFLDENIADLDFLTADEIQGGRWLSESQLDPGTYYVMLNALDFDCIGEPTCLQGYSNMLALTIPKPAQRYRASVTVYRFLSSVDMKLTVTPLGEALPYRVCWTRKRLPRKCVRGRVDGFSWNDAASDTLDVRMRRMRRRTTFSWYVGGEKVASKRVRIR